MISRPATARQVIPLPSASPQSLDAPREGRHRYYRLAGPGVATILESLAAHAGQPIRPEVARTPQVHALRRARTCYDHLAGELGVAVAVALQGNGLLVAAEGKRLNVTPTGAPPCQQ